MLIGVGVLVALVVIGVLNGPRQPIGSPIASPTLVAVVPPSTQAATAPPTATTSSPATLPPTPTPVATTQPPLTDAPPTAEPPTPEPPTPEPPTPEPPTPEPATPEPSTLEAESGRGDKVLRIEPQFLPTVATISYGGQGNFAVISYIGTDYDDLLVNEIGRYQGTVYIAPGVDTLEITSSGQWQVERSFIDGATPWDGASELTGEGDSVVVLTGGSFGGTTITNRGRSNFAIIAYSEFGDYLDLLVNEIGNYEGEVLLPIDDPVVLAIHAVGGSWAMSAVQ